jgi:hypothetical protein
VRDEIIGISLASLGVKAHAALDIIVDDEVQFSVRKPVGWHSP